MKTTALVLFFFLSLSGWAMFPQAIPVGSNLKSWQAQATTKISSGYVLVGKQTLNKYRTRLIVVGIDSTGKTRWQRKYPQLRGTVAGYGVAVSDSHNLLVTGSQNGLAKLWCINTQSNGDMQWTMTLDSGLARSAKYLSNRTWVVSVEYRKKITLYCLSQSGNLLWQKHFLNPKKAKTHLCATQDSSVVCAFAGHATALNSLGYIFWNYQNNAATWQNIFQRENGEVVLLGNQKMQFFGPVNDEAIAMATLPHQNKIAWTRSYGHDQTFDVAYNMGERPNGQLVVLARQDKRVQLLELTQNHSIARHRWLTDTLGHYRVVGMLNQSAWQQKWLVAYNRTDGTVWLQPTKVTNHESDIPANIQFRLHTDSPYTSLRPITEVPPTYLSNSLKNTRLHFSDVKGEGYVYLFSRKSDANVWQDKGWIQLGSKDSLKLSNHFDKHILLITRRPYASPLQLLLSSDAYQADTLNPERPAAKLSEQYPSTFNNQLEVDISANGEHFSVRNLPTDGWIPIVINTNKKNSSL